MENGKRHKDDQSNPPAGADRPSPNPPLLSLRVSAPLREILFGAVLLTLPALAWSGLTPAERRGKQIYLRGESASGNEITALMGETAVEVPASVLPCANCHGRDGRGNPEGGVTPTNIQWEDLTKPYAVVQEGGRSHPPYTLSTVKRAITMGTDPAGNALHVAMPRYRMTLEEMDDLLAYLHILGKDEDPGVSADLLRIGTLLPPPGRMAPLGQAIEAVLSAYLEDLNASGGLYNRRLELATFQLPPDPAQARSAVEQFLSEKEVFALAGAYMAGYEEAVAAAAQETETPLIGPFTLDPQLDFPLNRQVFYLFSGLPAQGRVAADFILQRYTKPPPPGAILYTDEPRLEKAAQAVLERAQDSGWKLAMQAFPSQAQELADLVQQLSASATGTVFLAASPVQVRDFLAAAERAGWHPDLMSVGSEAAQSLLQAPSGFQGHIFLTFPTLPGDRKPAGEKLYKRLASSSNLPSGHLAVQMATLASAELLSEGLKRAGRELTRENLVLSMEGLYQHETGFTPLIAYGPNRRIGALGAYVASLNLERKSLVPEGNWRDLR